MTHAHANHFDQPRTSPDRGAALSTSQESTSMSSSHPIRKPRGLLAVLALAAALLPLVGASTASAGTMKHWVCSTTSGTRTHNSEGWSGTNNGVPNGNASVDCSSYYNAGLKADMNNVSNFMPPGAGVFWTYTAPAGTIISTAHLNIYGAVYYDDNGASMGVVIYRGAKAYDADHVLDQCQRWAGCSFLNLDASLNGTLINYNVNSPVFISSIECGSGVGAGCQGGYRGESTVTGGYFNLQDNAAPIAGVPSGTAIGDPVLKGTETLAVPITDVGVGITDVEIKIGNSTVLPRQPLDTNGGRCVPLEGGYIYPQPCKTSISASLNVDTTKTGDGTQPLTMTVWDAAGNPTTAVSRNVTIDNVPPPSALRPPTTSVEEVVPVVGDVATATDGQWAGASVKVSRRWQRSTDGEKWENIEATQPTYRLDDSDLGKFIRVVVTATNAEGTTTVASARPDARVQQQGAGIKGPPAPGAEGDLGANGSGGNLSTGRLVNSRKSRTLKVSYGRKAKITGRLIDSAGHAIAGAKLDVYETRSSKGSVRAKTGSIITNDKGEYEYRPKTTASKKIDLAYAGTFGGAGYTDTLSVSLEVRAWVTLKTSRKSARRGSPVRLFGRVHGELPKRGVLIQLRALTGTEVIEFKNARTDSKGRFSYVRRFKNAGPFYFRAKMIAAGDVALASGESKVAKLRIR